MFEHVPFRLDINGGFEDGSFTTLLVLIGPVEIIKTVATGSLFLGLSFPGLDFFIASLGELRSVLIKTPFRAKFRPRSRLRVD